MEQVEEVLIDALFVQLIVSTFLPLLVGLLTKLTAPPGLKAVVLIVLNGVSTLITVSTQADGTALVSKEALLVALLGIIQSIATYFGVWRPLGTAQAIQQSTEGFGLGRGGQP